MAACVETEEAQCGVPGAMEGESKLRLGSGVLG